MESLPAFNNPDLLTTPGHTHGAAMTTGRKKPGGQIDPGSTSRYWFGLPTGADSKTPRKSHPAFAAFNSISKTGHSETACFMRGLLVHSSLEDAWAVDRGLYRGPARDARVTNPRSHLGPWCTGDGVEARRWNGEAYDAIECPNDDCPFAAIDHGCSPRMTLLFVPRWEGTPWEDAAMPQLLTKWTSKGRLSRDSFAGLVAHVREQAAVWGIELTSWYGLPFTMTLARRKGVGTSYPVTHFAADGELLSWLQTQRSRIAALGGGAEPVGLLDAAHHTADELGQVHELSSAEPLPVVRPASVVAVEPAEIVEAAPASPLLSSAARENFRAAFRKADREDEAVHTVGVPDDWTEADIPALKALRDRKE
jgi:hypothetical protein